ncbi:MAG: hypothetical protein JNL84_05955 [Candidatus Accumulibacter sp.]|nr:hypothetical protein [Accumulibacter sp.]
MTSPTDATRDTRPHDPWIIGEITTQRVARRPATPSPADVLVERAQRELLGRPLANALRHAPAATEPRPLVIVRSTVGVAMLAYAAFSPAATIVTSVGLASLATALASWWRQRRSSSVPSWVEPLGQMARETSQFDESLKKFPTTCHRSA